jgi:secreted PhoX family phosphatase
MASLVLAYASPLRRCSTAAGFTEFVPLTHSTQDKLLCCLTAETPMGLSGPAARNPWLKTSSDPSGTRVQGTLNNCSAGVTPWGTVLTTEENFQQYFGGSVEATSDLTVQALHKCCGVQDEYG